MPYLKIMGMPTTVTQSQLAKLVKSLVPAVKNAPVLGLQDEGVSVFFLQDQLINGLGEELVVEVCGIVQAQSRNFESQEELAGEIGKILLDFASKHIFSCGHVEVTVIPRDPNKSAFFCKTKKANEQVVESDTSA